MLKQQNREQFQCTLRKKKKTGEKLEIMPQNKHATPSLTFNFCYYN